MIYAYKDEITGQVSFSSDEIEGYLALSAAETRKAMIELSEQRDRYLESLNSSDGDVSGASKGMDCRLRARDGSVIAEVTDPDLMTGPEFELYLSQVIVRGKNKGMTIRAARQMRDSG